MTFGGLIGLNHVRKRKRIQRKRNNGNAYFHHLLCSCCQKVLLNSDVFEGSTFWYCVQSTMKTELIVILMAVLLLLAPSAGRQDSFEFLWLSWYHSIMTGIWHISERLVYYIKGKMPFKKIFAVWVYRIAVCFPTKGTCSSGIASIFSRGGGGTWTSKFPTIYTHQM